jgi:hypothetical protein
MRICLFLSVMLLLGIGCKDDKKEEPVTPGNVNYSGIRFTSAGTLNIGFTHRFNSDAVVRNTNYVTAADDTISVDKLRYYFSNVQLKNTEGSWINMGNYNLIDIEDQASLDAAITGVPAGTYDKIRFYVGVDSVANSSGAQDGALSPANDMFWSWNTGYVFFRLKGKYNTSGSIALDVGGIENLPVVELDLGTFKKEGSAIKLNMLFNLADVFITPTLYDLKTMPSSIHAASSPGAPLLRDNIQTGTFSVTSVE